jgi:hypothetical protein
MFKIRWSISELWEFWIKTPTRLISLIPRSSSCPRKITRCTQKRERMMALNSWFEKSNQPTIRQKAPLEKWTRGGTRCCHQTPWVSQFCSKRDNLCKPWKTLKLILSRLSWHILIRSMMDPCRSQRKTTWNSSLSMSHSQCIKRNIGGTNNH